MKRTRAKGVTSAVATGGTSSHVCIFCITAACSLTAAASKAKHFGCHPPPPWTGGRELARNGTKICALGTGMQTKAPSLRRCFIRNLCVVAEKKLAHLTDKQRWREQKTEIHFICIQIH